MPFDDTARLCVHTITTRPLTIEQAIPAYAAAGVRGITLWRESLEGRSLAQLRDQIGSFGLEVVSLCRGGFFPGLTQSQRLAAIDENKRAVDQAAALGASLLVLVPGALPTQSLSASRAQILEGVQALLPHAQDSGVKLGIEALHPMYAYDRSAVNTLEQANDLCDLIDSPDVGLVVDVYHLWWDPHLKAEIKRAGERDRIFAFHVSDWLKPSDDILLDRGLMGEGCIPLVELRQSVDEAGFSGYIEVEIFSNRFWILDQQEFLGKIVKAYLKHC